MFTSFFIPRAAEKSIGVYQVSVQVGNAKLTGYLPWESYSPGERVELKRTYTGLGAWISECDAHFFPATGSVASYHGSVALGNSLKASKSVFFPSK